MLSKPLGRHHQEKEAIAPGATFLDIDKEQLPFMGGNVQGVMGAHGVRKSIVDGNGWTWGRKSTKKAIAIPMPIAETSLGICWRVLGNSNIKVEHFFPTTELGVQGDRRSILNICLNE